MSVALPWAKLNMASSHNWSHQIAAVQAGFTLITVMSSYFILVRHLAMRDAGGKAKL